MPGMAKREPGPERAEVNRQSGRQGETAREVPAEMLGRELGLEPPDLLDLGILRAHELFWERVNFSPVKSRAQWSRRQLYRTGMTRRQRAEGLGSREGSQ